jgi:hypothetical protein
MVAAMRAQGKSTLKVVVAVALPMFASTAILWPTV